MPWKHVDMLTLRQEFVSLAQQEDVKMSALCERFGISRKTGYKWLGRAVQDSPGKLVDQSRRPLHTPHRTCEAMEELVIALRVEHPCWGGRKIQRRLLDLGHHDVPTASTVTRILHRHSLIGEQASEQSTPWKRFEHPEPNDLWQMDFKGYFETNQATCHPLTVLDDHSRYNLVLKACARPNHDTVQQALVDAFRRYGMPLRINTDNGMPWGCPSKHDSGLTKLAIWLIQLGIRISHSRPAHPQTNGKEERFHRTLKAEVLQGRHFRDLQETQTAFDRWRAVYHHERPHEAIAMATPVKRYRPSPFSYPEHLPQIVYSDSDIVITVGWDGKIILDGRRFRVSNALHTHRIAARPRPGTDGQFDLYFAHHHLGTIDLHRVKRCD